jgi:hypothetical protein
MKFPIRKLPSMLLPIALRKENSNCKIVMETKKYALVSIRHNFNVAQCTLSIYAIAKCIFNTHTHTHKMNVV